MGISRNKLARDIHVPAKWINAIINGKREIAADTTIRLGKYFKTGAEFRINLQSLYNLRTAEEIIKYELKFIPAYLIKPTVGLVKNSTQTMANFDHKKS